MERRKHPRLKEFDYSSNGAYFVTVCTDNRRSILSRIAVGRDDPGAPPCIRLTNIGAVVEKYILSIPNHYHSITVDKYVIMPNHIHLLLVISTDSGAPESSRPTVSQVIGALKRLTNKEIEEKLWQSSFHDHVIRDDHDYLTRWQYIDDNPAKWTEDEYFPNPHYK